MGIVCTKKYMVLLTYCITTYIYYEPVLEIRSSSSNFCYFFGSKGKIDGCKWIKIDVG